MEQLSEMDYTMLQIESNRAPQHISMVFLYDQTPLKGESVRFKDILQVFAGNLHKSEVFRCKLTGNTRGLDTPYWIADPDFDLEFHVRHIALPKPGDWRQFHIQLARLHSRGIDMSRSPWEAYVIEGLNQMTGVPEKSFALMLKVHHAAVDGVAMAAMLNGIHSLSPDEPLPEPHEDWEGEEEPSPLKIWSNAWMNNLRRPVKLARTLVNVVPRIVDAGKTVPRDEEKTGTLLTRFNGPVGPHRGVGSLLMDLDDVKQVKNSFENVTVNDAIVSLVGGGMRKYLKAKGELPTHSLSTSVPLSARDPNDEVPRGNQVSLMRVTLGTDTEDAIARLKAINKSARQSKEYASARGVRTILDISEGLWPPLIDAGFKVIHLAVKSSKNKTSQTPSRGPAAPNTIVSNVPGAQVPLYLAGASLHSAFAMGPLSDGVGLFHGVISTATKISITFVACRDMMPDPQFYRQCLEESWNELRQAAVENTPSRKAKTRKKPVDRATP